MIPRSLHRFRVVLQHIRVSQSFSSQSGGRMGTDEVLFAEKKDKRIITLNRPKALNALNLNMIQHIYPKMLEWEVDPEVSMVIIKGSGEKAFCAGGDILAVTKAAKVRDRLAEDFFREEYRLNFKIGTFKKPYIALIHGVTMGGGVGLSIHGKYRVATERTIFAMPETAIGLFPDVGGGHFLPWLKGRLGIYLALTGLRLKSRDVWHAGIATHFVETDKLPALEKALMEIPSGLPDCGTTAIEKILNKFHNECQWDVDKPFILQDSLKKIDCIFGEETVEDIIFKLEMDQTDWAKTQLQVLSKLSPTSLKITLRQLRTGMTLSMAEVLQMEYRLALHCLRDKDFYEGVRAVLIDKDQSPKWKPPTLEGVTDEKLDWYFSPLPPDEELVLGS